MMISEVLRKARRLLVEKGWTQGYWARDAAGNEVYFNDASATCFCIRGAISRVSPDFITEGAVNDFVYNQLPVGKYLLGGMNKLVNFNDSPVTTKEMVLEFLDKCIEKAEYGSR